MSDALEKRIKKHIIGKPHRFLAVSPLGFEQTLSRELEIILGETATEQPHATGDGKVEFTTKLTEAWKAVAVSRTANRVLMEVSSFKAENFRELEKKASEIPWELYLPCHPERSNASCEVEGSINIHVTCKHSRLYHSDAIAERLYKIIEGVSVPLAPADTASATPSAGTPRNAPSQNLYVNFLDDRCTIWLDLAGEELYKRGFERFVNDAPLKETIASAMIFEAIEILRLRAPRSAQDDTSHPRSITLIDLMSGSGTFSLEAACIANKIIPGTCRDFALKHQPAFKDATWNFLIRQETRDDKCVRRVSRPCLHEHDRVQHLGLERSDNPKTNSATATIAKIITSDISERAVNIIKHNIECSPLANISPAPIAPKQKDFFSYTAKEIADACGDTSPILVLNPPYGKRLDFDAPKLYTQIGKKLTELARDLHHFGKSLTVAILAPKDDTRDGTKYTCTANLLRECPALSKEHTPTAKVIQTSHGGFSLNAFFATI
ncbi:THUMP domain-containing class I SAM-dependent RNA methyltransferase [Fibrobacter succinogenes]|uniref:Putative N6-adenine-specific DNA methylase n=1 Tax=Fibrobacter succinogenes TaxID=833 RepID=A0A380RTS1_FIBSU|nr:RNA methyltransferase [Fibrobacter succinogenes]PWJ36691.1 putative N6-adenine-specific DNA methylase [Fibrobacter succinogenes subsp. elongatus]SUQ18940.1 putative N6-adenine-specific DNA methylase [Fibrobacter succinogenes]